MNKVFDLTVKALLKIKGSLTYNQINVLVWYSWIPFIWVSILCVKLNLLWIPLIYMLLALFVIDPLLRKHADDIFDKSAKFLLWFRHIGLTIYKLL